MINVLILTLSSLSALMFCVEFVVCVGALNGIDKPSFGNDFAAFHFLEKDFDLLPTRMNPAGLVTS